MNCRLVLLLAAGAVLLSACHSRRVVTPQAGSALQAGSEWQVEWLGERPLIDNSHLTLVLAEEGRAYGDAGCNRWLSHYELQGALLRFSTPASTMMACPPALMEQEQRFLHMLDNIRYWKFSANGQLQLWTDEGQSIRLWAKEEEE